MKHLIYILLAVICLNVGAFMALWKGQIAWVGLIFLGAVFLVLTFMVKGHPSHDDELDEVES